MPMTRVVEVLRVSSGKPAFLVRDDFDWTNPLSSKRKPLALHGTSLKLLDGIKREGLVPKCPVLHPSEYLRLDSFFAGMFEDSPSKKPNSSKVFATFSISLAMEHARKGPEIFEDILSFFRRAGVSVPADIAMIAGKINDFLKGHKPILLFVEPPSSEVDVERIGMLNRLWDNANGSLLGELKRNGWRKADAVQYVYRYASEPIMLDAVPPEAIRGHAHLEHFSAKLL